RRLVVTNAEVEYEQSNDDQVQYQMCCRDLLAGPVPERQKINKTWNRRQQRPNNAADHRVKCNFFPKRVVWTGVVDDVAGKRKDPKTNWKNDQHWMNRVIANTGWRTHRFTPPRGLTTKLCSSLQNSDAIVRILDVHVLPLHDVLNIERQISLQCVLVIIHCSLFFALAFTDHSRLVAHRAI